MQSSPPPSPAPSSPRSSRHVPLLSLAPPALALGDQLLLGEPGEEANVGEIWNVITRAADLVKDGERLENLAWRHWGQPHRKCSRRDSTSSVGTASTSSLPTPLTERSSYSFPHPKSVERRSFGGALKLLLEDDSNFRDWITDAKRRSPVPALSVPDTPVANLEIRLVEPTPVPSRVGSIGASLTAGGLLSSATIPAKLNEEDEEEEEQEELLAENPISIESKSRKSKKGKFFLHSSPSKGSGSDSSQPSPTVPQAEAVPVPAPAPSAHHHPPTRPHRKSSGSSQGESKIKRHRVKDIVENDRAPRRNISLSTMRGKFQAEKRRMAEALAAKEEDSGWEDDDEGAGEDKDFEDEEKHETIAAEQDVSDGPDEGWSDESDGEEKAVQTSAPMERSRSSRSSKESRSNLDLTSLFARPSNRRQSSRDLPPPPAPTPLRKMSKKERLAAAAERARIEAELEAQRKREMFAKQQIFGKPPGVATGLLTGLFKTGQSMIDLTQAPNVRPQLQACPTHGHLPALAQSPAPTPSLLRSKSAVAMPIQSGISVTISPQDRLAQGKPRTDSKSSKGSRGSQERPVPEELEMETSDESGDEDDTLPREQTDKKLADIVARRSVGIPQPVAPLAAANGEEMARARRREIIMREMSESLRRNVVLERAKSSGMPPRKKVEPQVLARRPGPTVLERVSSERNMAGPASPPREQPRRAQTSILGQGFLRPLTRVPTQRPQGEQMLLRAQSSANLTSSSGTSSPADATSAFPEAPPMARSSTDGDGKSRAAEREARRRSAVLDNGYRTHGW